MIFLNFCADIEKEILSQSVSKKRKHKNSESERTPKKLKNSVHEFQASDDDKLESAQQKVDNPNPVYLFFLYNHDL